MSGIAQRYAKQFKDAETFERNPYFQPGKYVVELISVKLKTFNGESFVLTFRIIEAENPYESNTTPNKPGSFAAMVLSLKTVKVSGYSLGKIKELIALVFGVKPSEVTQENFETFCSNLDMFNSAKFELHCVPKEPNEQGEVFTSNNFVRCIDAGV